MSKCAPDLSDVQQLVLQSPGANNVAHVVLKLPSERSARGLLKDLLALPELAFGPRAPDRRDTCTLSLGLSFHGLQMLLLPSALLGLMARLSPAFAQGAVSRAASQLGDTGASAASGWEPGFQTAMADLVVTLHGPDQVAIGLVLDRLELACRRHRVVTCHRQEGGRLGPPAGVKVSGANHRPQSWVHFGYRDGLSRVWVRGFPDKPNRWQAEQRPRLHEPGEFVLGHANNHGANPWLLPSASKPVRDLFRNGSFGVLRKIQQEVDAFEADVERWAKQVAAERASPGADLRNYVKAKLAGRWPEGQVVKSDDFEAPAKAVPPEEGDFEHAADKLGLGCPLGAHIRRMNPRQAPNAKPAPAQVAHARSRPLIRRGLPYGGWQEEQEPRGLLGHFFCASLEQQFEHLLGQWADRMPLGTGHASEAKDPLIGQHEDPLAKFLIPHPGRSPSELAGFHAYCTTRGTVYLFYPSRTALELLCQRRFTCADEQWEGLP